MGSHPGKEQRQKQAWQRYEQVEKDLLPAGGRRSTDVISKAMAPRAKEAGRFFYMRGQLGKLFRGIWFKFIVQEGDMVEALLRVYISPCPTLIYV